MNLNAAIADRKIRWKVISTFAIAIPALIQFAGGFGEPPQLEGWGFFRLYDQSGPLFYLWNDSPISSQAMRPLTALPNSIAWLIESDGFAGFHIVQGLALSGQAFGMYKLLYELGLRRRVALSGGLLFSLFPAWTGLFAFRTIHFHSAAALLSIATWLLLRSRIRTRPIELVAVAGLLCAAVMFYEGYYSVVLFCPLLLLVNGPVPRAQLLRLSAIWFIGPVVNAVRIVWVLIKGPPQYQEITASLNDRSVNEIWELALRVLWGSLRAFVQPPFGIKISITGFAIILILMTLFGSRFGDQRSSKAAENKRLRVSAALCFVVAPFTALVYWSNSSWLVDHLRIFSVSSFPFAIGLVLLIESLEKRFLNIALCAMMTTIVLVSANGQRDYWHRVSDFQEHLTGQLVTRIVAHGTPTNILLFDSDNQTGGVYTFPDPYLEVALHYLLRDLSLDLEVCRISASEAETLAEGQPCSLTNGVWSPIGSKSPDDTLVLELHAEDLYTISGQHTPNALIPERAISALHCLQITAGCSPIPSAPSGAMSG